MTNPLSELDKWMNDPTDNGFTVMLVANGRGRVTCIMRSKTQSIGKVGEGDTCEDALLVALGRKSHYVPTKPAHDIASEPPLTTRPVLPGLTRPLLPGLTRG